MKKKKVFEGVWKGCRIHCDEGRMMQWSEREREIILQSNDYGGKYIQTEGACLSGHAVPQKKKHTNTANQQPVIAQ